MIVTTYGTDRRTLLAAEILRRADGCDTLLLPIPSSKNGSTLTGTDIPLTALISAVRAGMLVAGFRLPAPFVKALKEAGAAVIDTEEDPTFTEANARLSALGCLTNLLSSEERAPCDLSVAVIGYGRIGQELVRLLLFLGAHVTVMTAREDVRRALGTHGIPTLPVCYGGETDPSPLLSLSPAPTHIINTAPSPVFRSTGWQMKKESFPCLIELSSRDGFPLDLPVWRMPSLPAACFPVSAAGLYADAVLRMAAFLLHKGDTV